MATLWKKKAEPLTKEIVNNIKNIGQAVRLLEKYGIASDDVGSVEEAKELLLAKLHGPVEAISVSDFHCS